MIITYRGKKNPLTLNLPYLSKPYHFQPGVDVDVEDNDGRLLVGKFPQSFITDTDLDEADVDSAIFTDSGIDGDDQLTPVSSGFIIPEVKAIIEQSTQSALNAINQSQESVSATISEDDVSARTLASECGIVGKDDDFTFETGDRGNVYLCPLCEKTYKVNKGRGKYVMIEHLEKDHAEEWLELQTRPDEA